MKKSEIVEGGIYTNAKGVRREVLSIQHYEGFASEVMYSVFGIMPPKRITLQSFAQWAIERVS